ncbi:MAG: EAL domain-containing protein, partial [Rhizobiales bacterium]|nr:EAL domain-containing protein [Hyphomicrobiales bacterium]
GAGDECDPEPIAERIMEAFSKPFSLLNDINVDLECTIGISLYPNDAENVNDLLIASDLALYRAKQAGKNQFLLFDRSMREEFQNKVELARRVKSALELGEFEMFYQPQIEMRTGRVLGIEALLRWRDPERGLRMPTEFIEVIEHSDGAQQLGTFVLDRAISDAAEWHRQGINFGRLGINITAAQLRDTNFIDHFLSRLLTHGLPPEKTAVEILESTVLSSQNRRLRALFDELNDLDISVEFDDFGTGYASLMHLRQLPVNRVKIDREFVLDLPNNDNHENIVHGVINFVTKLGLELVAEGVETVEQAQLLSSWGCECAQGYLFARPAAVEDVTAYLKLADYKRSLEHVARAQAGGTEDLVIPMAAGAGADPS